MKGLLAAALLAVPPLVPADGVAAASAPADGGESFVIDNPAFPSPRTFEPVVEAGRRFDEEDLSPYFTGPLEEAYRAFEQGRYARARTLLDRALQAGVERPLPVRYLRAMAALRASDHAFAAAEFAALADEYAPMRDRCLLHGAVASEEAGQLEAAARLFAAVREGSKPYVDARLGLARVLRKRKDYPGALAALAPISRLPAPPFGRDVGAEALAAMADLASSRKDAAGEKAALLELWSRHPLSRLADKAESRLGGASKLPMAARVDRAEVLIESHRNRAGLEVLEPLLKKLGLPDGLACRAHFLFGKALRKERQHTRAIAVLSPVVEKCTEPMLRAKAMYVLATSQSIVALPSAAKTYEALAREFPEHAFADDALFYAADAYAKLGQKERALERLTEIAERYPGSEFAAEALFKASWIHRASKRYDEQLRLLDAIEQRFEAGAETFEVERARYWRARTLEAKGEKAEAIEGYASLAVEHPAGYYGLLARVRVASLDEERARRIREQLILPEPARPWPRFAGPISEDPRLLAGIELLRLGFGEAASAEFLAIDRSKLPSESVRLLVQLLSKAKDARAAHAVARTLLRQDLSGRITAENRPLWEIAYPNAFGELVDKHCKESDVEPALLKALMREESALDPLALSWAGAVGLTQLMPSTAKAVARRLKLKAEITLKALLDPDLNIRLGTAYLASLQKRFSGQKQLMLAGYNAGETAVERWRRERAGEELDEWVENIPIAETRGYVKRVLRSYNAYLLLYGDRTSGPIASGER